jgi:glycerol-3-phosphate acyltransferase PlsY
MTEAHIRDVLLVLGAYLMGSIPFGLLFTRGSGVDITKQGSGNIGATNVLRTVGKKAAALTLASDLLKGTAAVAAALLLGAGPRVLGATGLAAVLGHDFSVFRGFRGGKGVATSIGVILLYTPLAGLVTVVVWLAAVLVTRVSALGALSGFAAFPVAVWLMGYGWEKLLVSVIISVLLFIRHTSNIREMLKKGRDNASGEA